MTPSTRTTPRWVLPLLLLVSGFCGISYEILYTKLLGNLLGNQFMISASVLLTFLLGIGLGTLYAHRFVRKLWAIEAGIGVYAAIMVMSYGWIDHFLYATIPEVSTSLVVCAIVSIVLLSIPAFLVGCSVPLFAAYLSTLRSTHVFSITYGIYNFGAATTALAMEFVLLRAVGLRSATLLLAALNIVVAVALIGLVRSAPIIPPPRTDRLWFRGRELIALALGSVTSAIFQLLMIKISECVIGPFNETFALVLATVLLGIALGALIVGRLRLTFNGALLLSLAGILWLLVGHGAVTTYYASIYRDVVQSYPMLVFTKLILVMTLTFVPAVGFGATIPALLKTHRDVARESGQLLFVSSMGNVVGFLLMAFVLHRNLDYGPMLLIVALLAAVAVIIHSGMGRGASYAAAGLVLASVVAHQAVWDERVLYYGHENFQATHRLNKAKTRQFNFDQRFKGFQDVFAITYLNDKPSFFINGYISIPLTAVAEKVAGSMSVMYAPRTDDALVLGIGSGATAGTVGLFFDRTEAVEINGVILQNLHRMSQYNFDLEHQQNTKIIHDDGIHYLKTTPRQYSLIVNTVTTPIYFSSSKLYTRDFLDHVLKRLKPDGVYTTWVDSDIGDAGVSIIVETLDDAFEQCWLNYLKSSYYLFVCSNEEIHPHQAAKIVEQEDLKKYLGEVNGVPSRFLPYSAIHTNVLEIPREPAPINTLDFPVLEHEMAMLKRSKLFEFNRRLELDLNLPDVEKELETQVRWDPAEFSVWRDLRTNPGTTVNKMLLGAIDRQFALTPADYAEALKTGAEEIGTAEAYYEFGRILYKGQVYTAAEELLQAAIDRDPAMVKALVRLGDISRKRGQLKLAEERYGAAFAVDSDNEDLRRALKKLEALRRERDAVETQDPA